MVADAADIRPALLVLLWLKSFCPELILANDWPQRELTITYKHNSR